ncbi:hypothetical protein FisN_10Lu422 [Fistulifera solaris]|uniref:Uncharacterized protein n=1 Tax=Fistulifera solaris TaxID=1519565 RepID=A0A1Z5JUJ0_FISSO|nr:hypothetical protein FisN_10Lu422 [Fistulifera solaris]|eukprot:GAX17703.1 hypothetical protein FisN_10Lu422 [Fistulifera solaris]
MYCSQRAGFSITCQQSSQLILKGAIYGERPSAIAETATFLWSLPQTEATVLRISCNEDCNCVASAFKGEQLARILDSNPTRRLKIQTRTWTSEQSVILATRPYPLNLHLLARTCDGFRFEDEGAAFVKALEMRSSSFGDLNIQCQSDGSPFHRDTLQRLLQLENKIEKLTLCALDEESVFLPFSAKVEELDYGMDEACFRPEYFDGLSIAPKRLHLRILFNQGTDWTTTATALLKRFAELGHFEKLGLSILQRGLHRRWDILETAGSAKTALMAEALVRAIEANPNLSCLDLRGTPFPYDWYPYLQNVFEAMEKHKSLRQFFIDRYPKKEDPHYLWLERLLLRNRCITVLDRKNRKPSNGSSIEKLYALNSIYRGSISLIRVLRMLRSLLVAAALTEGASTNFQYTALLLSHHTDMLYELLHYVDESLEVTKHINL